MLTDLTDTERAHLIELVNAKKKYGLVWEDKPEDVEEQLRSMLPVLNEVKDKAIINGSEHPNHILIEGDNLHALTALTFTHEGKIDVIYIDPPYNTGNKDKDGTTDFKYNDDYVSKEDVFRHSMWLSFIHKRLVIAKKLLSKNGFMAVSIDDNEFSQLKILMDDIFNENVKTICVKMSEASGLKMSSVKKIGTIPKYKEYLILARPKGINSFFFDNISKENWDSEYNIYLENFTKEERNYIDEIAEQEDIENEILIKLDKIVSKVNLKSVAEIQKELKITKKSDKDIWCFENAWRICQCASSSSVLHLAKEKKKINSNNLFFVKSNRDKNLYLVRSTFSEESSKPRVQMIFADSNLTFHPGDLWTDIRTTGLDAEGKVKFKNGKKPIKLLNRILKSNANNNCTILDFFAGSGSTLHSIIDLNSQDNGKRVGILVTNNENGICEEITHKRIENVISEYQNNNLRYYKAGFVPSERNEVNRRKLTLESTDLLCIKENCFFNVSKEFILNEKEAKLFTNGLGKYMMVVYHSRNQMEVIEKLTEIIPTIESSEKIKVYAFSPEKETIEADFLSVADKIEAVPLPDSIYNAYRATFRILKLDKKQAKPVYEPTTEQE